MFVAIVGTRYSGKSTIEDYLVSSKGFTSIRLVPGPEASPVDEISEVLRLKLKSSTGPESRNGLTINSKVDGASKHLSFLSMSPLPSPAPTASYSDQQEGLCFYNPEDLLNFVTENWQRNFVTCDLNTRHLIEPFTRRPFFLLLHSDAPLLLRYRRSQSSTNTSLVTFVQEDDQVVFGASDNISHTSKVASLQHLSDLVNIHVTNVFPSLQDLQKHLDKLDLLDPEHLRPSWDAYFMTLASLASRRSNCMKRRVGAILVRTNRVLATGYNGTPRGLTNCNEGGCSHCNSANGSHVATHECLCLHAEENALLEAGRERIGEDCVLYCNTCPCLKCTVKIIQTGVKTVVYNLTYKVDDASAALFTEAGVHLRRYDPISRFRLLAAEDEGLANVTPTSDSDKETIH